VTLRRTSTSLGLEREVTGPGGAPERLRLSARFESGSPDDAPPNPEALREALDALRAEMDDLVGRPESARGGLRPLEELVETYRPRQAELVELLQEDGEISVPEAELLHSYLARAAAAPDEVRPPPPGVPPPTDRPIAAMPLEHDRSPSTPRPIAQLLEIYRIQTLKQAGAVRARRQISFEEYMALKRHFSVAEAAPTPVVSESHPPGSG
jgi:hypothetical protein